MAGDWVKWVKGLSRRREVLVIARMLAISRREAACACMEVWEWADDETVTGRIKGATREDIDRLLGLPGFAAAMESPEVGWLRVSDAKNCEEISFPRWSRNNGESAKRRAMDARKKRRQRDLGKPKKSPPRPDVNGTKSGLEERERERERREEINTSDRTDRKPLGQSDLDVLSDTPQLDFSSIDWGQVEYLAGRIGKVVSPATNEDRRAFLRYAVLAQISFNEDWINQALGALNGDPSRVNRAARFVGALQKHSGMDDDDFNRLARQVEIPRDVWSWKVLEVHK